MKLYLWFTIFLFTLAFTACSPTTAVEPSAIEESPIEQAPTNDLTNTKPTPSVDPNQPVTSETPVLTAPQSAPTIPADALIAPANLTDIQIMMLESFPVGVQVKVDGYLPDGCTHIGPITVVREGNTFQVSVNTNRPTGRMCTQMVTNFQEIVILDVIDLPAGEYTVTVNDLSRTFTLVVDNVHPQE